MTDMMHSPAAREPNGPIRRVTGSIVHANTNTTPADTDALRPPAPRTLSQLVEFLKRWPRVRIHAWGGSPSEFRFIKFGRGAFHFWEDRPRTSRPYALPTRGDGDGRADWRIEFAADGFTVVNGHGRTRVDYLFSSQ